VHTNKNPSYADARILYTRAYYPVNYRFCGVKILVVVVIVLCGAYCAINYALYLTAPVRHTRVVWRRHIRHCCW